MKKSIVLVLLILVISVGFVMAQTVTFSSIPAGNVVDEICMKYDDFSGQNLSLNKWQEILGYQGGSYAPMDIHEIRNGVYYAEQINAGSAAVQLIPNRTFVAGESIKYDINYTRGIGPSNMVHFFFNGVEFGNYNYVGYWGNTPGRISSQDGLHKFKFSVVSPTVGLVTVKRPDGSVYNQTLGIQTPVVHGFQAITGGGSTVIATYDNVQICRKV